MLAPQSLSIQDFALKSRKRERHVGTLSSQLSALSSQLSSLSPQLSALSSQPSALSSQPSSLSPQVSALKSLTALLNKFQFAAIHQMSEPFAIHIRIEAFGLK